MSNGKLIHRIYIGTYCDPEIIPITNNQWLFEDGKKVLTEGNKNLI